MELDVVRRLRQAPVAPSGTLREPALGLAVAIDDGVLARLQHQVEIAPVDGLVRPPAVDDPPFLAHALDAPAVHPLRDAVAVRFDERRRRLVQSSRGTSSARASGMRDHGATSITIETPPAPTAALTWRRPCFNLPCSTSPSARTSSSCSPVESARSTSSSRSLSA